MIGLLFVYIACCLQDKVYDVILSSFSRFDIWDRVISQWWQQILAGQSRPVFKTGNAILIVYYCLFLELTC